MKNILTFYVLFALTLSVSCTKEIIDINPKYQKENGVAIQIINNTNESFDVFEFIVWNSGDNTPLFFEDIKAGESSPYQYIAKLKYDFYNPNASKVYFAGQFTGKIAGDTYNFEFGLCGTGLSSKEVYEGAFLITINSIDKPAKRFTAIQSKEE